MAEQSLRPIPENLKFWFSRPSSADGKTKLFEVAKSLSRGQHVPMAKTQATIPLFLPHRGCPGRCVFCSQRASGGRETSTASRELSGRIEQYLMTIDSRLPRIEAAFFGGNFTGLPSAEQENLLNAALPFLESGRIHGIRVSTRPDFIDPANALLLKNHGVDIVELGVQSLSDEVLTRARRGHGTAEVYRAVDILKAAHIKIILQIMAGLPGDTRDLSAATAVEAAALCPDGARIFPTVVLRGTELERLYRAGEYKPLTLDEAVEICADMRQVFTQKDIPVIRTGLHPLRNPGDEIIAGPYHPAFGFLVKARLRRREMEEVLKEELPGNHDIPAAEFMLPREKSEEYIGNGRENIRYLKEKYRLARLDIILKEGAAPSVRSLAI